MNCAEVRLQIGAEPEREPAMLGAALAEHLGGCPDCRSYRAEMLQLNGQIHRALELGLPVKVGERANKIVPLVQPAAAVKRRPPPRWLALAASVVLAVGATLLFWPVPTTSALASELVRHIAAGDEGSSWTNTAVLPRSALDFVLRDSGVTLDADGGSRVIYAHSCELRGRLVPHLVLQTERGPLTVVPLVGERLRAAETFRDSGLSGVLLPVAGGAIAVLARGPMPDIAAAATAINKTIRLGAAAR